MPKRLRINCFKTSDGELNCILNNFVQNLTEVHFNDDKIWCYETSEFVLVQPLLKKHLLSNHTIIYWDVCLMYMQRFYQLCREQHFTIVIPTRETDKNLYRCHETSKIYQITNIKTQNVHDIKEHTSIDCKYVENIPYRGMKYYDIMGVFEILFFKLLKKNGIRYLAEFASVQNIVSIALFLCCPLNVNMPQGIKQIIALYVGTYHEPKYRNEIENISRVVIITLDHNKICLP